MRAVMFIWEMFLVALVMCAAAVLVVLLYFLMGN